MSLREEASSRRADADRTAADILANAEARGRAMVDEAQARTDRLVADAEERLAKIRIERDAVAGYFEGLRGVLSRAGKSSSE